MFFRLNAPKVSFREYMYEGNLLTMPFVLLIACVVKLFRIRIPSSTDIPSVRSLDPFRGPPEQMDPTIFSALGDMEQQLEDLGFVRVDLISIDDMINDTRYGGAVYRSPEGDTVAWVRYRLWANLERKNKFARLALYSLGPGGEVVLTTAATRDLLDPPSWHVEYHPKLAAQRLIDRHRQHVLDKLGRVRPMIADNPEAAFALLEHTHEEFVEFQLERGVFLESDSEVRIQGTEDAIDTEPLTDPDAGYGTEDDDFADESVAESEDDAAHELSPIIEEVRRQETKQSGWVSKLIILAASIAIFIGLGAWQWELELVLLLVPILFVHELGHYVAMKMFGYKNIHMFFIPLLGAAVSGRNYRVSGWKKAIVSLAGPLPSIVLGAVIGIAGLWSQNEWLLKTSLITLILNVMNLAPFLPLDGGQVAHITLFSRSSFFDILFRIATILALLGAAFLLKARFLFVFGILMALGLPTVWRTLKLTARLRKSGLPGPEDDHMPVEAIEIVVDEVRRSSLPTQGSSTLAKMVLSIYETVIVRPPSWPATVGIWALYFMGLISGLGGMIAVAIGSVDGDLFDFVPQFEEQYETIELSAAEFRRGNPIEDDAPLRTDLLAWRFPDAASASAAFVKLKEESNDSVSRLGELVFVGRPNENNNEEEFDPDIEEDFNARLRAQEARANNDPRLAVLSGATWSRSFGIAYPQLTTVTDDATAEKLVETADSLPDNIAGFSPIAPWTPGTKLTAEQQRLQKTLRLLQGHHEDPPWEVVESDDGLGDRELSPEEFRAKMQASARLAEQTRQNRLAWMKQQSEKTSGTLQQLFQAFVNYEDELASWREDKNTFERGPPPRIDGYLAPLLEDLGYLHPGHPMLTSSVTIEAYRMDDDLEDRAFMEGFPLEHEGRSVIYFHVSPSRDAAAAFACIHDWLKDQGIARVAWTYTTPKPED